MLLCTARTSVCASEVAQKPIQLAGSARSALLVASAEGAKLDSNLLTGGGTDDTQRLQRLLDRAAQGHPVHLVIDGPALVSGLKVHSNTTIECTAGGGLYLMDGSPGSIIRNVHRSRDAVIDRNIEILGCFLNGNQAGQRGSGPSDSLAKAVQEADGTFKSGLQFFGIERLNLTSTTLFNVTSFGAWIANATLVEIRNVTVDSALPTYPEHADLIDQKAYHAVFGRSDDGIHFNGPIRYVTIDGARLRTWDDGIALNANDFGVDDLTKNNEMGPYIGQGSISDVLISNVILMDSQQGFRLLSVNQEVDRITIQNVTGRVRGRMAVISSFQSFGKGKFGSLLFSNINVGLIRFPRRRELFPDEAVNAERMKDRYDYGEEGERPIFSLNGGIESLSLDDVVIRAVDNRPLIRIGSYARIGAINVKMTVYDPQLNAVPVQLLGQVDRLNLALDWQGSDPIKREGGNVLNLHLNIR